MPTIQGQPDAQALLTQFRQQNPELFQGDAPKRKFGGGEVKLLVDRLAADGDARDAQAYGTWWLMTRHRSSFQPDQLITLFLNASRLGVDLRRFQQQSDAGRLASSVRRFARTPSPASPHKPAGPIPPGGSEAAEAKAPAARERDEPFTLVHGDELVDLTTEDGLIALFRTIVGQDKALFPGDDVAKAVGALKDAERYLKRRYIIGAQSYTMNKLFGLIRVARAYRENDTQSLPRPEIIRTIRHRLGWQPPQALQISAPGGVEWDFATEEGILKIIRAVIKQDKELYPGARLSEAVRELKVTPEYMERPYEIGYGTYTMGMLFGLIRVARGRRSKDVAAIPDSSIVKYVKYRLGGKRFLDPDEVKRFVSQRKLDALYEILAEAPGYFRDFLAVFYGDELDEEEVLQLVRTFSGLRLYTEIHRPVKPGDRLKIMLEAMLMEEHRIGMLKGADFERALRIMQYLMGKSFEDDPDAAEALVRKLSANYDDPRMKVLLERLIAYFRGGADIGVEGLADDVELKLYQRLGVQYLVNKERALLGDQPGMGKTLTALAAAETLRAQGKVKKVLIIAPANVKKGWEKEIAKRFKPDPARVVVNIEGGGRKRKRAMRAARHATYVITNYAFLRKKTPEELRDLLANVDLLIADEAQMMSNPDDSVLQAKAVREIEAPRRWLLTATPYYSHPEHIYSLLKYLKPEMDVDFGTFKKAFTSDIDGLRLLHGELAGVMIRRRISETLGEYEEGIPLDEQGVRMPRKVVIPPELEGAYTLTRAQVELLRELSQDVKGWMVRVGYRKKMTHFTHLQFLYHASVDPAMLDESLQNHRLAMDEGDAEAMPYSSSIESGMYPELDRIVARRIASGEKILIFAHNKALVKKLATRYARHGALPFNSEVKPRERRAANLNAFETDPAVKILVAGVKSGGVGLNIKAADVIIHTQRSLDHSAKLQGDGRPQRYSATRRKEKYDVVTMEARYPKELLAAEEDPAFRLFMEQGTVSEILEGRLADLDRVHHVVMDGIKTEKEAQRDTVNLLVRGIAGLRQVEVRSDKHKRAREIAQGMSPLWTKFYHDADIRTRLTLLTDAYYRAGASPRPLVAVLEDLGRIRPEDLDWIASPFAAPNKRLRARAAQLLPFLIRRLDESGCSLAEEAAKIAPLDGRASRVVLPLMAVFRTWEDDVAVELVKKLVGEIAALPQRLSSTRGQALTSLMVMATSLGLEGNGRLRDFLVRHAHIFVNGDLSLERRTSALERIAILNELSPDGYLVVMSGRYDDIDALSEAIRRQQRQSLAIEFGLMWSEELDARVRTVHGEWGEFRPLVGLLNSLKRMGTTYVREIEQLKEVFSHVIDGDYHTWRNEQDGARAAGNKIPFLANSPDFWKAWTDRDETVIEELTVDPAVQRHILGQEYEHLERLLQLCGSRVSKEWFRAYVGAAEGERVAKLAELAHDNKRLVEAIRKEEFDGDDVEAIRRYYRGEDLEDGIDSALHENIELIWWTRVLRALEMWKQGREDVQLSVREAGNWLRRKSLELADSDEADDIDMLAQLERIRGFLGECGTEKKYEDVRIYDTDDPYMILRMGALAPDMVNCFNFHGDPHKNHVVTGVLGSRNARLVIAEVKGRIRSVALARVRQTEDGDPVLFLERSLHRSGYNFEREMAAHLVEKKSMRMARRPLVARQVHPRGHDITMKSTGCYSQNEYAEALFGVRESMRVEHGGQLVFSAMAGVNLVSSAMGLSGAVSLVK